MKSRRVGLVIAMMSLFAFGGLSFAQSTKAKPKTPVKKAKPAETKEAEEADSGPKFSLKQKKFIASEDRYFESRGSVARLKKECGVDIVATIDWASFKPVLDDLEDHTINKSAHGYCDTPLSTIAYECSSEDVVREAVASSITSVECHYGGKGKMAFEIKGGVAHFYVDFDAPNQGKFVAKRLGEEL